MPRGARDSQGGLRECLGRRLPLGDEPWNQQTAIRMDLQASLRPRGRPRKNALVETFFFGEDDDGTD